VQLKKEAHIDTYEGDGDTFSTDADTSDCQVNAYTCRQCSRYATKRWYTNVHLAWLSSATADDDNDNACIRLIIIDKQRRVVLSVAQYSAAVKTRNAHIHVQGGPKIKPLSGIIIKSY